MRESLPEVSSTFKANCELLPSEMGFSKSSILVSSSESLLNYFGLDLRSSSGPNMAVSIHWVVEGRQMVYGFMESEHNSYLLQDPAVAILLASFFLIRLGNVPSLAHPSEDLHMPGELLGLLPSQLWFCLVAWKTGSASFRV